MTATKLRHLANGILVLLFATSLLVGQQHAAAKNNCCMRQAPAFRNYTEYEGVGILVFDLDHGLRFVKRIPTWVVPAGQQPETSRASPQAPRRPDLLRRSNRLLQHSLVTSNFCKLRFKNSRHTNGALASLEAVRNLDVALAHKSRTRNQRDSGGDVSAPWCS